MEQVNVNINGVYINATHFAQFTREEAVKRIQADNITHDANLAGEIYDKSVEAVKAQYQKEEQERLKREEDEKLQQAQNQQAVVTPLLTPDKTLNVAPSDVAARAITQNPNPGTTTVAPPDNVKKDAEVKKNTP